MGVADANKHEIFRYAFRYAEFNTVLSQIDAPTIEVRYLRISAYSSGHVTIYSPQRYPFLRRFVYTASLTYTINTSHLRVGR